MDTHPTMPAQDRPKRSGIKLFLIVFSAVLVALLLAIMVARWWLFPSQLQPVELRAAEKLELNHKLRALGYQQDAFPELSLIHI